MGKLGNFFLSRGWGLAHRGFCRVWLTQHDLKFPGHEVVETSDSVALLVYDKTNRELVFVKQKRPAMVRFDNDKGITIEVLAGRFDVKLSVRALMVKEAKEELGLTIQEDEITLLNSWGFALALSPGILTEKMYLGYVEVESSRFAKGNTFGADPGEETEPVRVPIDILDETLWGDMKTWALVQWFIAHKLKS